MKQFWKGLWNELGLIGPRMIYFLKTGKLHPDLRHEYGIWPKYEVLPTGSALGTYSLHYNGESITYQVVKGERDRLISVSNSHADWALQWANTEIS